ncbi:hypothetical protein GF314_06030 [bacterium]|nr:hypothetical protein [bacterium]
MPSSLHLGLALAPLVLATTTGLVDVHGALQRARAAHNAYDEGPATTRDEVFTEALGLGFPNVELDVVLVDHHLEVRHDCDAPRPTRTLDRYLEVLAARVADHRGSVHGDGREFVLTIDVKDCAGASAGRVAALLDARFRAHRDLLSRCEPADDPRLRPGAITVCLTGDDAVKRAYRRRVVERGDALLAFADRVIGGDDEPTPDPTALLPERGDRYLRFVAIHWRHVEPGFDGDEGDWTEADRQRLVRLLESATARGLRVRFYALNGEGRSYRFVGGMDAARARWHAVAEIADGLALQHFVATDDREAISRVGP